METEPKARSHHRKRRERAHRLQIENSDSDGELDGDEFPSSRGTKERSRSKPRKKKGGSGTYEEDIIDGFAIVSFKSIEDLEKFTSGKLTNKTNATEKCSKRNSSLSPARHKQRQNHVRQRDKQTPNNLPKKKHNNSAADNSESSGETTDNLDASDLILNGPKKTITRRFSDVSTRSSSGAGYLCDSESGNERASDASLDVFPTKPLNHTIKCDSVITTAPPPPVSSHLPAIITACNVTCTTSDVTVTTATTTTSCVSLATTLTTTSVTVTTASPTVNTVTSNNHFNHHRPHQQQHQQHNHHNSLHQPPTSAALVGKYSPHHTFRHHHQQKPHHDRESRPTGSSPVIKRRPPTPTLTKPSRSPPRHRALPPSLPPSLPSSISSTATSLQSSISNSVINREPKRTPPPSRTPRREEPREREAYQVLPPSLAVSKSFYPPGFPGHGASTPSLYSPLGPSPGLHPSPGLYPSPGLHPSHSAAGFPGSGIPSLHQHLPSEAHTPHNMFAPPMPLGPPAGPMTGSTGGARPAHMQPDSPLSITNPDILREELNRRFLASQERSSLLQSVPPYLRADIHQHMHQHQHQHQHQHMHQHMYHGELPPPPSVSAASLVPTPTPNPYEKLPSSPFFRQGLPHRPGIAEPAARVIPNGKDKPVIPQHPRSAIPGLPGYPSLLLNPSAPDALNSGLPGAFQPKGLSGIHPSVGPMFMPGRELDKGTPHLPAPQTSLPTMAKKPGKWCAVHVRIAWEIYHHQQKQSDKGSDSKPTDQLRPPSHMMPGSSLPRPQEMPSSASSSSLLAASGRGLFDNNPHGLLNSSSHLASFPRPSPYSIATSLALGMSMGNGLMSTSREPQHSIPSGSHEWNRLHRTPPTFHTPASWTKTEDREMEMEREREREMSMERRREEERERERRLMEQERHRFQQLDDRERDRFRENNRLDKSRSRSRSRSPMRNGRVDSAKSDRSFERRPDENNLMKIKEERRESLTREDDMLTERDRLLKNDFLTSNSLRTTDPFVQVQASMLDRARMLNPAAFMGGDPRVPPHPSFWNPFDKGPVDFQNHRLSLQREMETRDHLFSRFPMPGVQPGFGGFAALEQERLREEMIMSERAKRDYLERLPLFERERLYYEHSKIPSLRPPDPMAHHFARNMSPALNHIRRSSPAGLPGAPPPLIHSSSSSKTRGHSSPAVNKTKGVSPTDSVGESKRDSNSNSTDPDAHSR